MADPTRYIPGYNYSGWEADHPTEPKPGAELDNDFALIRHSIDETIRALKDVRRSDGKIQNTAVDFDALSPAVKAAIANSDFDYEVIDDLLAKDANLQDLPDKAEAIENLGALGRDANLSDLTNAAAARSALGAFSTVADVQNSQIPAVLESIRTLGRDAPGDGGGADLTEAQSNDPGAVPSGDGRWWKPAFGSGLRAYGAKGDGVADDGPAFTTYESLVSSPWIPEGTYKLGARSFEKMVSGPGRLIIEDDDANSAEVGGFQLLFDPRRSNIYATPDIWAEKARSYGASPGDGPNYFNTALAPGSNINDLNVTAHRNTLMGHAVGEFIIQWERNEAIGNGAMRAAQYAQRTTAVGTLAFQWLGASSKQHLIDTAHDFWLDDTPDSPTWDFMGLESRNPGIRQKIDAWDNYPSSISDVAHNVAVGRDAGLHSVVSLDNTFVGYQAATNAFEGYYNTAIGNRALRDSLFVTRSTALGRSAGVHLQEGDGNLFLGASSGINLVRGNHNILLGTRAAEDLIAGAEGELNNALVVQRSGDTPWLVGNLESKAAFFVPENLSWAQMEGYGAGVYHVIAAALPNSIGRFLGSVTSSYATLVSTVGTGITTTRTHAIFEYADGTVLGSITTSDGNVAYNTSSDYRLKQAIGTPENALDRIKSVDVRTYHRLGNEDRIEEGFFAHEIQQVCPWAVTGEKDEIEELGDVENAEGKVLARGVPRPQEYDYEEEVTWTKTSERPKIQQVDYSKVVPTLWAAVQELAAKVEALQ